MPDFKHLINQLLGVQEVLLAIDRELYLSVVRPIAIPPQAPHEQINEAERQLGLPLPDDYRDYLKQVNGKHQLNPLFGELYGCTDVRLFRQQNSDWIDAYLGPGGRAPQSADLTEEEHRATVDDDVPERFRLAYLPGLIEISRSSEGAVYLLNPSVSYSSGTCEVWAFANWLPGAARFRSFLHLVEHEYRRASRDANILSQAFDSQWAIEYISGLVDSIMATRVVDPEGAISILHQESTVIKDDVLYGWFLRQNELGRLDNAIRKRYGIRPR